MTDDAGRPPARRGMRTSTWWVVLALLAALVVGYVAGAHRTAVTNVATGSAVVGESSATITSDGYAYALPGPVPWIDSSGARHDTGWPTCLPASSTVTTTFGWTLVTYPDGTSGRQVAYVDCRS